ncbi:MAG: OmpH family outer membrane protein [Planctomycetota bacterium]
MKTQMLATIVALSAALAAGNPAHAQVAEGANAPKVGIAVIDINYIFNEYEKHSSAMDSMKSEIRSLDTQLKSEQQKIMEAEKQKAEMYKPGTADYRRVDEQVVQMKANFQVKTTQMRKDVAEREAGIYYQTYREVDQAIKYYAKQKGISLVVRFNGDEADPNNRDSILRSINKTVHYQDQIDITPDVLGLLNRAAANQAGRGTTRR